jgi:hypothetical protein
MLLKIRNQMPSGQGEELVPVLEMSPEILRNVFPQNNKSDNNRL